MRSLKTISLLLTIILLFSSFTAYGFDSDKKSFSQLDENHFSDLVSIPQEELQNHKLQRYIIFGHGQIDDADGIETVSNIGTNNGFLSIVIAPEQSIGLFNTKGYYVIPDFPLEFHDVNSKVFSEMDQIRKSTGSEPAYLKYNYTGKGIKIAIVDTGVDFSNPDIKDSLARDDNNNPIMLDADGQGLVITNATFAANIDKYGIVSNITKSEISKINKSLTTNVTSNVYLTKNGVFLNLKQKGKGTPVLIYNS
ncbi:MAG: peptidase S8, partial [Nitrosopumilaceae archaeon]|nr:peptidase S8 [Nitrosopumilaceae archaeon]